MKVRFGLKHALSFDSKNYLYLSAGQNVQARLSKKKKTEREQAAPTEAQCIAPAEAAVCLRTHYTVSGGGQINSKFITITSETAF